MTKTLIAVVGSTAIGKTALSIKLAKHFSTEILSADSRQFYKEMTIGTAVPSTQELSAATHHFIQNISVTQEYSVGDYERDALQTLEKVFKNNEVAIMVGGSGLYVAAVTEGLDRFPKVDSKIRETLNRELETGSLENLQQQLKALDPDYYKKVDLQNPQRVIRALEVSIGSGKPYSSFLKKVETQRSFKTIYIAITTDRDLMYERINNRVDLMMANGLLDEVKMLSSYKHLNALNTVGYKELFQYLDGEISLEVAISEIKKNTRRFAKRQLTWLKRNKVILWFDCQTPFDNILKVLKKEMQHTS